MILYHYCPTDAFVSIVAGRSVRLSMLNMSNDEMEGRWIREILVKRFSARLGDAAKIAVLERLIQSVIDYTNVSGFCLSEEPDVLSQWVRYADGGMGMAIGFDSEYWEALGCNYRDLEGTGFGLARVLYGETEQLAEIAPIVDAMARAIEKNALSQTSLLEWAASSDVKRPESVVARKKLLMACAPLMLMSYRFKHPSFYQEKEWRLLHVFDDEGGALPRMSELYQFASRGASIVPYRSIQLRDCGTLPVRRVVCGPKNQSRAGYLASFLRKFGFFDVEIARSESPYR